MDDKLLSLFSIIKWLILAETKQSYIACKVSENISQKPSRSATFWSNQEDVYHPGDNPTPCSHPCIV